MRLQESFCMLGPLVWMGSLVCAGELADPVRVEVAGVPLDVERIGHAAPFFGDFDGDGLPDLLVGQFEDGRLRVFRNLGTRTAPRFEQGEWFRAGGDFGRVPVG